MTDQSYSLRYVIDTLSAAQRDQLPRLVPTLTTHLANCSEILCSKTQNGQATTSSSSLVHQLRTQISSLLQDKSPQGRWAAVVLVKVTTESVIQHQEGWDFLRASTFWVRGLLEILKKSDPLPTKTMVILLLTRIFLLTHGQASLTREITTPHLDSFVTACLNLNMTRSALSGAKILDLSSGCLEVVLQCFIRLLPNHPAIFRTFSGQIRLLISSLVAATPSDLTTNEHAEKMPLNEKVSTLARHLHALLPLCAVKNGASEEWSKNVRLILNQIDQTTDKAFRAIQKNRLQGNGALKDLEEATQQPVDQIEDDLLLPRWYGVAAGCERIQGLLSLLSAYLTTKGNMNYRIPIKAIYEMAGRLLSTTPPQGTVSENHTEEINRSITREERERLFMMLPQIHTAVIEVLSKMMSRMSAISFSIVMDLMDQIMWTMERSHPDTRVRTALYKLMDQIVEIVGSSISPSKAASINAVVKMACKDLVTEDKKLIDSTPSAGANGTKLQYNADSFLTNTSLASKTSRTPQACRNNALRFLCNALFYVPASSFITSVRSEIDKIAVLLQHEELQLISVLNPNPDPGYENTNLVPFLAKYKSPSTEALIHRRLGAITRREEAQENDGFVVKTVEMSRRSTLPLTDHNISADIVQGRETQSGTERILQAEDTFVSSTKRNAENGSSDLVNSDAMEIEHTTKKPKLDNDVEKDSPGDKTSDETLQTRSDTQMPTEAEAGGVVEVEEVTANADPADSASDDSFEIPEIFVDSEDDDSEAESQ